MRASDKGERAFLGQNVLDFQVSLTESAVLKGVDPVGAVGCNMLLYNMLSVLDRLGTRLATVTGSRAGRAVKGLGARP
jgi:hypothetical protein